MNDILTRLDDGTLVDNSTGVIINQVANTENNNNEYKVYDCRINCAEFFGKVFVGASKERCVSSVNSAGTHELEFTFCVFNLIKVPDGTSLFSDKFKRDREFGHIIGIDKKGRIFSAYCKSYALSGFKDMIDGFLFDLSEGTISGSLVGKKMLLSMGALVKATKGNHFEPSIKILSDDSPHAEKAEKVARLYRNNELAHSVAVYVKI